MNRWLSKLSESYHWIIQPLLVVGILLFGFFGAMTLSMFKEQPQNSPSTKYIPLVRVIPSKVEDRQLTIKGNGTLEARTRINIVPQVGGRIDYIHPNLRAGGRFKANEVLLEIQRTDYQLAVTEAEAEVTAEENALEIEIAEASTAKDGWFILNPKKAVPVLVGHGPQIAEAHAHIRGAKARLQKARLDLQRTRISMPFTGRVVETSIDVGEVVGANQSVGIVYDSERFEIPVPLEVDQLAWIQIPNKERNIEGSPATIKVQIGGQAHDLSVRVVRIESELDSISRLARVVVALDSDDIPDSLINTVIPGLFVDVEINTQQLKAVSVVPKSALRENGMIWTVEKNRLYFIRPNIVYQTDSELFVRGLASDTLIVISHLDVVTDGMSIRTPKDSS